MTNDPPAEPRTQRARLGAELRRLRKLAGLPGRELAPRIGVGQATLSRIENGQAVPSIPEVTAWADATSASPETRINLVHLTEAALNEVETWRARLADGLPAMQHDMRALEATTGTIRIFQTAIVPALLQTADYARQVFTITDVLGTGDYTAAVAARLERQHIIYDPARQFEFLMTESALRWQPGPQDVLTAQLDRITTLATLPHIAIGVIPLTVQSHAVSWTGFNVYEDREDNQEPIVTIEVPHARVVVSDPADVEIYRTQLTLLRQDALYGNDAISFFRRQQQPGAGPDSMTQN